MKVTYTDPYTPTSQVLNSKPDVRYNNNSAQKTIYILNIERIYQQNLINKERYANVYRTFDGKELEDEIEDNRYGKEVIGAEPRAYIDGNNIYIQLIDPEGYLIVGSNGFGIHQGYVYICNTFIESYAQGMRSE